MLHEPSKHVSLPEMIFGIIVIILLIYSAWSEQNEQKERSKQDAAFQEQLRKGTIITNQNRQP